MTRLPLFRRLALAGSACVLASLTLVGCGGFSDPLATPVFSTQERFSRIQRNFDLEGKMMQDDIDSVLMLRPTSNLTQWHIP